MDCKKENTAPISIGEGVTPPSHKLTYETIWCDGDLELGTLQLENGDIFHKFLDAKYNYVEKGNGPI